MQENNCKYVSSRGILKSCTIHSLYPISSNKQLTDYDFSKCTNTNGSTFYICSSAVKDFIEKYFPLPFKIVLVTGDCDETCWEDLFSSYKDFISFIENEKIIHWFSQNCTVKHPKISQIPIGLDYHTMSNNYPKWGSKLNPIEQENVLENIINSSKPFWEREIKCYSNFHFLMTYDRVDAFNSIPKHLVYYEPIHVLREQSWNKQIKYAFVISPHGNGFDCHRTWEALILGCIPIVKKFNIPLERVYDDLPVLIINNLSLLSNEYLEAQYEKIKTKVYRFEKLYAPYWKERVRSIVSK